jgi:hypothetical protein
MFNSTPTDWGGILIPPCGKEPMLLLRKFRAIGY